MTNTLYRVKFLILKNLASIAKERDDVPLAISAYLEVKCASGLTPGCSLLVFLLFLFEGALSKETHCYDKFVVDEFPSQAPITLECVYTCTC